MLVICYSLELNSQLEKCATEHLQGYMCRCAVGYRPNLHVFGSSEERETVALRLAGLIAAAIFRQVELTQKGWTGAAISH